MIFYRLSPKARDGKDAWTSVSDVGKVFDGVKFTFEQYLDCENRMLAVLNFIQQYLKVSEMRVRRWYKYSNISDMLLNIQSEVSIGCVVSNPVLDALVRSSLREDSWCFLTAQESMWLTVGDDYNIHIATTISIDHLFTEADRLGLALKQVDWLEDGMREQIED